MADINLIINRLRNLITKDKKNEKLDIDIGLTQNRMQKHRFTKIVNRKEDINDVIQSSIKKYQVVMPSDILQVFNSVKSIYLNVPEFYQAINIIIDNMLSPDATAKEVLNIIINSDDENINNQVFTIAKTIIDDLQIENIVTNNIILDFLLYGNSYVWVRTPEEIQSMGKIFKDDEKKYSNYIVKESVEMFSIDIKTKYNKQQILLENNYEKNKKRLKSTLDNINLEVLDPFYTVPIYIGNKFIGAILITTQYDQFDKMKQNMISSSQQGQGNEAIKNISNEISKNIINSITKKYKLSTVINDKESMQSLHAAISNLLKNNQLIEGTYFIPSERIVHFKIPSNTFKGFGEPYGLGVINISKFIIASDIAQMIYRLTRAAERRIFKVNVFDDQRSSKYIQEIINQTKRKEYAVRGAADTDTLINEVTMFDDYYIPIYNGEETMSVDVQAGGEMTNKIEDLEYFRKKLISGLGIPAIYLVQDETTESKYTLSQENIRFSRTIIKLQKFFGDSLSRLIQIIYMIVFGKEQNASIINVQLKPPRSLQLEREAEMIQNLSNLAGSLKDIAPETFQLDRMINDILEDMFGQSYFTYDKLSKFVDQKIKNKDSQSEESGEMGGGFGGGELNIGGNEEGGEL